MIVLFNLIYPKISFQHVVNTQLWTDCTCFFGTKSLRPCACFHPLGPTLGMALPDPERPWHCHLDLPTRQASFNFLKNLLCPGLRTGCQLSRLQNPHFAVSLRASPRWDEKARAPGRPSHGAWAGCNTLQKLHHCPPDSSYCLHKCCLHWFLTMLSAKTENSFLAPNNIRRPISSQKEEPLFWRDN